MDDGALAVRLAAADHVGAAGEALLDHLMADGWPLPSLYLESGGRLRCQGVRGYWQVLDGIPPGVGVIGSTFAGGVSQLVRRDDHAVFLEAVPDIAVEVCVPIRADGRVIGVVSVESHDDLPDDPLARLERCAALYANRLTALGGPPQEFPAQRLGRHASRLAELTDAEEIHEYTLAAACDLAAMSSSMIVRFDEAGSPQLCGRTGLLASPNVPLSTDGMATIASWVAPGTSCYTMGEASGAGFLGHEVFRDAGACAMIAVPLSARGQRLGVLVVADAAPIQPRTDDVGLLDLLATQVAGCLLTAKALADLRDSAARDPLTGLGHHASFNASFNAALTAARQDTARPQAVILIDVDRFKQVNDTFGHLAGDEVLIDVAAALTGALRDGRSMYRIGGDEFATVVDGVDEDEAMAVAARLRAATAAAGHTTSIGVAVAVAGESDKALLARADTALYAVKAAGRDGVALAAPPGREQPSDPPPRRRAADRPAARGTVA